jgi:hypothetical protein
LNLGVLNRDPIPSDAQLTIYFVFSIRKGIAHELRPDTRLGEPFGGPLALDDTELIRMMLSPKRSISHTKIRNMTALLSASHRQEELSK